jgi:SAM-dependent methyltransferase
VRCLEIGPNKAKIPGFETTDIMRGPLVDHVQDCRAFTFKDGTFDLVYSCHVLEHLEWHEVEATVAEWARIVKPGGHLEIHCLNALDLMKALITYDETGEWHGPGIGTWCGELTRGDPYLWACGRILNRPKGGNIHQNHRALITPNYLRKCIEAAGLEIERQLTREDMRRSRHADFINIGYRARKPAA